MLLPFVARSVTARSRAGPLAGIRPAAPAVPRASWVLHRPPSRRACGVVALFFNPDGTSL